MSSTTPTRAVSTPRLRSASAANRAGVRPSMGSVGDCYDNALAESFSPPWNANSLIAVLGVLTPKPVWPCSSSSKAGTTHDGDTAASITCPRSTTSDDTPCVRRRDSMMFSKRQLWNTNRDRRIGRHRPVRPHPQSMGERDCVRHTRPEA